MRARLRERARPQCRRGLLLAVPLAVLGAVTAIAAGPAGGPPAAPAPLLVETGPLRVGVTLAQRAADPWENPAAVASAHRILAAQPMLQAQSLMGWGVGNPEPSPGVYDWSGLDRRIGAITATQGTPVLILAGAPDWMTGGRAGTTDWHHLGRAPTAAHVEDFAHLAAMAAQRYPDVHRFLVWNELDGFWDRRSATWDMAAYTRLYNAVFRAIKAVAPSDLVGGPYLVLSSYATAADAPGAAIRGAWGAVDPRDTAALSYWLRHAVGADFVAVDADSAPTWGKPAESAVAMTAKFSAVDRWLRARTARPIWWSEFYVQPTGSRWSPGEQAAVLTVAMARMAASGAQVALLWGPEADGQGRVLGYLWTSAEHPGGGRATPLAASIRSWDAAAAAHRRLTVTVMQGPARAGAPVGAAAWRVTYGARP